MSLFMPTRRVRHKKFDYEPRYYDPTRDDSLKRRMQVQRRVRRRRSPVGLIYAALLLVGALYFYNTLG